MLRTLLPCTVTSIFFVALIGASGMSRQASADSEAALAPAASLQREIGTDFELADWSQVASYYQTLAAASPHVALKSIGKSTEGRDFLAAIISSEQNLQKLPELLRLSALIADPRRLSPEQREQVMAEAKVILFITPTMHSDEPAATEMAMQFSWQLATSNDEPWRSARDNVVVVVLPSLNPDGIDHIANWVRDHRGTPLEASPPPTLYHKYAGHDNNRDYFALNLIETRLLTQLLYRDFHPQVLWDVHQQGSRKERMFIPPYRDPLSPNIDPAIVAATNLIGTRAVLDMTREGLTGIASGTTYENWWNGGNRSTPARHNVIGLLTEAASVNMAAPIFLESSDLSDPLKRVATTPSHNYLIPWPGGWWRLRNIIEYELAFGRSLLASLNREPQLWLRNCLEAADRAVSEGKTGSPRAWLIPTTNRDVTAVKQLVDRLMAGGVEVHALATKAAFGGRTYPAGTLMIDRAQPYGRYAKDLFEAQTFPVDATAYDVTGWTLPLLYGVHRIAINESPPPEIVRIASAAQAVEGFPGAVLAEDQTEVIGSLADSGIWRGVVDRLNTGAALTVYSRKSANEIVDWVVATGAGQSLLKIPKLPRVGVYAPWTASIDEGWLRWTLEDSNIPYATLRNDTIAAARLKELCDVLIIPDLSTRGIEQGRLVGAADPQYAGGLSTEALAAITQFVAEGGKLITFDDSSRWAIDLFELPIIDASREGAGVSCSGSLLRAISEKHRIMAGAGPEIAIMFDDSSAWRAMTAEEIRKRNFDSGREAPVVTPLLTFPGNHLLLSGQIRNPDLLAHRSAWSMVNHGQGTIHLFGFRPHYRGWTRGTFTLLMRAIFFDP